MKTGEVERGVPDETNQTDAEGIHAPWIVTGHHGIWTMEWTGRGIEGTEGIGNFWGDMILGRGWNL